MGHAVAPLREHREQHQHDGRPDELQQQVQQYKEAPLSSLGRSIDDRWIGLELCGARWDGMGWKARTQSGREGVPEKDISRR